MGLLNNPTPEVYQTWARGLSDLSDRQIKVGLAKALSHTGYFTLPIFRELCKPKPEDFGLPEVKKAYIEACMAPSPKAKHKWSHPAVYHAGKATGWFELATFAEDQIYPRFKTFYAEMCDRVMNGEKLDAPMIEALPDKVTVILTPEQNQDRMAKLRQSMGL
jgi:hypothetical protein